MFTMNTLYPLIDQFSNPKKRWLNQCPGAEVLSSNPAAPFPPCKVNQIPDSVSDEEKRVLSQIECISFKLFKERLNESVLDFQKLEKRNYTLILSFDGVSTNWVASLAAEQFSHFPPVACSSWFSKPINTDIAVFIDDAAYSGNQMIKTIESFLKVNPGKECYLIAPFGTTNAEKAINQISPSVTWTKHWKMQTIEEKIGDGLFDQAAIDWINSDPFGPHTSKSMTIFQHKLPDTLSIPHFVFKACTAHMPPYKNYRHTTWEKLGSIFQSIFPGRLTEYLLG